MKVFFSLAKSRGCVELLGYLLLFYFTGLMVLITAQYVPIDYEVAFLRVKQQAIQLTHYQYAFFIHVYTSLLVLLTGLIQCSALVRRYCPKVHRVAGRWYVALILLAASPSGLVMGWYANGGLSAQISFILLAILWFIFTYQGYVYARRGHWQRHRSFMLRSFALTLSAISLRLFKWVIAATWALPPMDTYVTVAWAGWVVNLAVTEAYIHQRSSRTVLSSSA